MLKRVYAVIKFSEAYFFKVGYGVVECWNVFHFPLHGTQGTQPSTHYRTWAHKLLSQYLLHVQREFYTTEISRLRIKWVRASMSPPVNGGIMSDDQIWEPPYSSWGSEKIGVQWVRCLDVWGRPSNCRHSMMHLPSVPGRSTTHTHLLELSRGSLTRLFIIAYYTVL